MIQESHTQPTHFGELLRYLRRRMQMTQQELANALGYSATMTMIARLENGERLPDLALVKTAYIEALGLKHEPALAQRLVDLAVRSHGVNKRSRDNVERSDAAHRTNLPVQLTHFVDREKDSLQLT